MNERLACYSIRLIDAPGALVERVSSASLDVFGPGLVLRTCERFELYEVQAVGSRGHATGVECVSAALEFPRDVLARHIRCFSHQAAAGHLLRVAAGLESRIIGEPQILRQVRCAYLGAMETGTLGPVLSSLGRSAIRAGRRVRRETDLGASQGTLIDRVGERLHVALGGRVNPVVVIVGTGKLAHEVATRVRRLRLGAVRVVSRRMQRAGDLSALTGATAYTIDRLREALCGADALVTCTSGPSGPIADALGAADGAHHLTVIDLGAPSNVDPDIARRRGLALTTLDELARARSVSAEAVAGAEEIVAEELARFERWRLAREHVTRGRLRRRPHAARTPVGVPA